MTSDEWSRPTISQTVPGASEDVSQEPLFTTAPTRAVIPGPPSYQRGANEPWHAALIERTADIAVAAMPIPLRVLDVGCGDGQLLEELLVRVPYAEAYVGVDPSADVLAAGVRPVDPQLRFVRAAAESLPFADASFDLVLATASFGYWLDQRAGIAELARVVTDHGKIVLVEPTRLPSRGRNRGVSDIVAMLTSAGLRVDSTEVALRSALMRARARAFIASL